MDKDRLASQLAQAEGLKPYAYQDSVGLWTIGVGHLVDKAAGGKLHPDVIQLQLQLDIAAAARLAEGYSWYAGLNAPRQNAIVELLFNLGKSRFDAFHNAIEWLERHDYEKAADEFMNSKWATQVGKRAERLTKMIRVGDWQ